MGKRTAGTEVAEAGVWFATPRMRYLHWVPQTARVRRFGRAGDTVEVQARTGCRAEEKRLVWIPDSVAAAVDRCTLCCRKVGCPPGAGPWRRATYRIVFDRIGRNKEPQPLETVAGDRQELAAAILAHARPHLRSADVDVTFTGALEAGTIHCGVQVGGRFTISELDAELDSGEDPDG